MIEHLVELCKHETPIVLGSLINSFDKIYNYQASYNIGVLNDRKLDSWIDGKINGFFVSITFTPLNNEIEAHNDINNTDIIVIVNVHVQLCNDKYFQVFYENEEE